VAVVGMGVFVRRRRQSLPALSVGDVVLVGVATHKLARRLSKSSVTSPLRAPFTRYEGVSGPAELHEEVRGRGLLSPRATRLVASLFASLALADGLQFAYCWAERQAEG
jgi:hypothetical protein